ncbi:hypothetical protein BGW38_002208 [Lunasporangiospora selenospora]|uniref:Prolyl 4-hydroxylase alpha subunit domain-containing protein n=1 Tax=Lunasporangiospora selenospora TaxID=979761 RepID=A0A9P6FSX1_9FUNG|nr:hypothetical protein BGW38_002208 [Lunasporangiospora selenospora]
MDQGHTQEQMQDREWADMDDWPRLSSPSKTNIPRWVPIIGPSQVLVLPNFFTAEDSKRMVDYILAHMKLQIDDKLDPTKPRTRPVPRPGYAYRDNDRISLDSEEFATMLWNKAGLRERWNELWMHPKTGLETVHGEGVMSKERNNKRLRHAVGLSRNIRFYRYQTGQSFGAHYDESVMDDQDGSVSEYTVLIYLNGERDSDLIGGETVFYPKGSKTSSSSAATSTKGAKKNARTASSNGTVEDSKRKRGKKEAGGNDDATAASSDQSGSGTGSLSYTLPNGGIAVKPDRGLLLVHKHGDECMLHEALTVQQGFKFVLRTDVVYEP